MSQAATTLDVQGLFDHGAMERLRSAAAAAAKWEVLLRPRTDCAFLARVRQVRRMLRKLEADLAGQTIAGVPNDPGLAARRSALLELGANHRLLRAAVNSAGARPRRIAQLPRVVLAGGKEEPQAYAVAAAYFRAADGVFSASTLTAFLRALQEQNPLNVDEMWNIGVFLKFALVETLIGEARALMDANNSDSAPAVLRHLKSLREIANADWVYLIEPLICIDACLREDPARTYERMDFESRELYRQRIAQVAQRSDCSEMQVAQAALELARAGGQAAAAGERDHRRRMHAGYYLIDKGFPLLANRVDFHPSLAWRARQFVRDHSADFFFNGIQVFTILFIAAAVFPILPRIGSFAGLLWIVVLLLLPAMHDAVGLINSAIAGLFDPQPLPKLDFSAGIPEECTTLVAVPTLLLNEKQVRNLVNDLEVRFLANRDPNLHFALLTDLPDSVGRPCERDTHPLVELAVRLIEDLNRKYDSPQNGAFLFLHRHRVFNTRQGVWMGWERKRGKLLDLNKLITGESDAFPTKVGRVEVLNRVRYVLTLDADTQLPPGTAARLAGAIAHPLNQAVIDPKLRIVTAGYGILQPRIGIAVRSATRSRLAAIYSGQTGFDIYSRAVSDVYQDLFDEGIFTGKGIYEVAALHAVLNRRFPRNFLLSHDLIEGAYARAGLASDIELVDDYPSHYSAYSRRLHRWVRGDWQIAQWMFSRVPDESGRWVRNPISEISRWKIADNLRRSLVDPALFILFVAGWLGLPGGPLYWTAVSLLLLFFPTLVEFAFGLGRAFAGGQKGQQAEALAAFGHALLLSLLRLIMLPHQTLLALDAIARSLVRRFITGERLLEWETAAQTEAERTSRTPMDRYLAAVLPLVAALGLVIWLLTRPGSAIFCALPILALWALASPVTIWLDHQPRERYPLPPKDRDFLSAHALRIWRYFAEFSVERHNFLIPDNVDEEGYREAPRVSPTNIGLLLNARQAACELGFLTVPEFAALSRATLATVARLEKHRGHLYNWYDTQTLQTLGEKPFVSSVDSGNFVASLYTLNAGLREIARKPLLAPQLFPGLHTHWRLMLKQKGRPAPLRRLKPPRCSASMAKWMVWLPKAQTALAAACAAAADSRETWLLHETRRRVDAILALVRDELPWLQPEYKPLGVLPQLGIEEKDGALSLEDALDYARTLVTRIDGALAAFWDDAELAGLAAGLRAQAAAAIENLLALLVKLRSLEEETERLAGAADFAFLANPSRQMLSIGYEKGAPQIHDACYDMIASEARMATFLAIARGDLPYQSWCKLSRDHAYAYGRFLLLSWSGTMFEYLMPALWMRSYPGTLIARTQDAAVHVQRVFARRRRIPWGISESGAAHRNEAGHYHYYAYGVPRVALWFEASAGPVISPYSTFLALTVDAREAFKNLHRMDKAGWTGAYGFYEAADYTQSRRPVLVREWMAHHLGMSLLAVTNLLRENAVQRWFHNHPQIQAAELLLHEMPVSKAVLKARRSEIAPLRAA